MGMCWNCGRKFEDIHNIDMCDECERIQRVKNQKEFEKRKQSQEQQAKYENELKEQIQDLIEKYFPYEFKYDANCSMSWCDRVEWLAGDLLRLIGE